MEKDKSKKANVNAEVYNLLSLILAVTIALTN